MLEAFAIFSYISYICDYIFGGSYCLYDHSINRIKVWLKDGYDRKSQSEDNNTLNSSRIGEHTTAANTRR